MTTTQSIRYNADGSINLIELDVPDPAPNEIQLTSGACGICSWDIATCKMGDKMSPMAPPGHEGVGYVSKIGAEVTGFKEGDRVTGGGFSLTRNVAVDRVHRIPDSDLADQYWIVEPVSCAVTGLDRCNLRPGNKVVLIGSGFMGLLLLQGLLHSPLDGIVVIDIVQSRLDLAKQMGAAETYNAAEMDSADLCAMLKAREIDVVLDSTGSQPGLDMATDIVKRGGLINIFGWIKGQRASFDPTKWHLGGFSVVNSAPASQKFPPFPAAIRLIHQGVFDLKPLVTHTSSLNDYPALMGQILTGDADYIKGVVMLDA
ncbi:MAG: zinc-binding dehydrogenase [Chloroflexota bacterium]